MTVDPTPFAVFDEFLAPMELAWAHRLIEDRQADFTPSQVIGSDRDGVEDHNHRRSRVLYDLGVFHDILGRRLIWFLPHVVYRLGIPMFDVDHVELQLTSSSDGEFFRAHTDSDNGPVISRHVTFVLFCHREPRAFSGGDLVLYGRDAETREAVFEAPRVIRPSQNRMILFPSDRLHEVMPVEHPGGSLMDSRLTLNGWLHR
jgi:Rps23 Pro-64 3,4-dihydroxylase Tpa1-like proline 4-hydroxylase